MLFDDLKAKKVEAMKAHDSVASSIIGIVVNKAMLLKIEKRAKNEELTDSDVYTIINKTIKELDEEIKAFETANRPEKVKELNTQKATLLMYQPKMLTDEEIIAEIAKLDDKSMPAIMRHFKQNFQGRVDMKKVSEFAKQAK